MNPLDLKEMMQKAQEMQSKMGALQQELAKKRFEASAGAGMITAVATGDLRIVEIRIEEGIFAQGDRELIQDLTAAAVNAAIAEAQRFVQTQVQQLSLGGLSPLSPDGGR